MGGCPLFSSMQPLDIKKVKENISSLLKEMGADLIELSTRHSGGRLVLQILVDRTGGITLGEVAQLNRSIGQGIDETGLIEGPYLLEVNSPGLDRPLKTEADFRRLQGELIKVVTRATINGENTITGTIEGIDAGLITVSSKEKGRVVLSLDNIARAKRIIKI